MKEDALEKIEELFKTSYKAYCYFSGHASKNRGKWIFEDGYISPFEVFHLINKHKPYQVSIFNDSCHSGHWAIELQKFM